MPKERVLYILGAGFSAPLGIPVMHNFLLKAKDQHALGPAQSFADVFRLVDSMSKVKNFCTAELFNVEEVLSILEMQEELAGTSDRALYVPRAECRWTRRFCY